MVTVVVVSGASVVVLEVRGEVVTVQLGVDSGQGGGYLGD